MTERITTNKNESKKGVEDNARKFVVDNIDPNFLKENGAISFTLVVDWIETNEDSEKTIVYKKFEDGRAQILLITKITTNNSRMADRREILEDEYKELLKSSILRSEKKRYEFKFVQDDVTFNMKYDEFNNNLKMLEVDALDEEDRNKFKSQLFPYKISEVTGNIDYYGYRVAESRSGV